MTDKLQAIEPELRAAIAAESTDERLKGSLTVKVPSLRSLASARFASGEYVREALDENSVGLQGSAEVELRAATMGEGARANVRSHGRRLMIRGSLKIERGRGISAVACDGRDGWIANLQSSGRVFAEYGRGVLGRASFRRVPSRASGCLPCPKSSWSVRLASWRRARRSMPRQATFVSAKR